MKRVLLIDDDPDQLLIYTMVIEELGYEVVGKSDARQALKSLDEEVFDVLVSDLMMPGMSGEDLVVQVRSREQLKDLPIVLISGAARDDLLEHIDDPNTCFVEKGRDMTRLIDAIKTCAEGA